MKYLLLFLFLWVLLCPKGHQVYFTDRKIQSGDVIAAEDYHTNNRGSFFEGTYQPLWWKKPFPGQEAKCPICKRGLWFLLEYIKELK